MFFLSLPTSEDAARRRTSKDSYCDREALTCFSLRGFCHVYCQRQRWDPLPGFHLGLEPAAAWSPLSVSSKRGVSVPRFQVLSPCAVAIIVHSPRVWCTLWCLDVSSGAQSQVAYPLCASREISALRHVALVAPLSHPRPVFSPRELFIGGTALQSLQLCQAWCTSSASSLRGASCHLQWALRQQGWAPRSCWACQGRRLCRSRCVGFQFALGLCPHALGLCPQS